MNWLALTLNGLLYGLLAVAGAIALFVVMLVLALPLMAWIKASRAVLWPVLDKIGTVRRPTQYVVADLGCLLAEMSLIGVMTAPVAAQPGGGRLALLLLLIAVVMILSAWRLAVQWLTRTRVHHLPRRVVFQLFVVPLALFFPIVFLILCVGLLEVVAWTVGIDGTADVWAVVTAGVVTVLSLRAGQLLARWVAASAGVVKV